MHDAAHTFVAQHATDEPVKVLDIGGRDINGTVRPLFPNAEYTVLDIMEAPGVDIVADASVWPPDREYDVVVCCEVFEHTPVWRDIVRTAWYALAPGGRFITTMAGPGREPHSAFDGAQLRPGEWYANVEPDELGKLLDLLGFDAVVDVLGTDVRAVGVKHGTGR